MVSVASTQYGHCSLKVARENIGTNGGDCVLVKLYLQKQEASSQATVCEKLMY